MMRIEKDDVFVDVTSEEAYIMLFKAIGAYLDGKETFVLVDPAKNELEFPVMNFIQTMMRLLIDEEHTGDFSDFGSETVH